VSAYHEETVPNVNGIPEQRIVMKFPRKIAPYTCAVLPLMRKEVLVNKAREVFNGLLEEQKNASGNLLRLDYDEPGSIGKRYRRQDEIGTPYCVTIDFDTLKDSTVTVRHRDTMKQDRVNIHELRRILGEQ